jgi:hypothetical protein
VETEHFIECCEWCGRDTAIWGRFYLQSGPGLKMVLCAVCADNAELRAFATVKSKGCEVVCSPMITDR